MKWPPLTEREMVELVDALEATERERGYGSLALNLRWTDAEVAVANLELERRGRSTRIIEHVVSYSVS